MNEKMDALATCFSLGIILQRTGRFPSATPAVLNGFVIYVSLPALTLLHIHKLQLDMGLMFTACMAWALFGFGFVFFRFIGKWAGLSTGTIGALMLVGRLGGSGKVMQVTLFEAAMAPMITAGIIAIDHELKPALVTLMIGIGIPLSFLTLSGWWWLLQGL